MGRLGILARSHFALRDLQWRLFVCGWSERGVEDGREGGVECIDQLGLAFVSDAYHARYPRLTFSLEAADKSFIWTSVHQKEGQRKEGRKK